MGPVYAVYWAPWSVDLNDTVLNRWMERNCAQTDMDHQGVEWDWLMFFWQLWTDGDDKLTISEIKDIWPVNIDPEPSDYDEYYYWSRPNSSDPQIIESADDELNDDEFLNFVNKATAAGVAHGH